MGRCMPRWLAGWIVYMTYLTSIGNTVNPACDCVVYQSYGGSHGQFTSPNFPKAYEKTNCILYTFIGDVDEIIELNFIQFDMKMPDYNRGCTDFLRLFLNLDRPQVNENNRHDEELCGNMSMIKKTYYSSSRSLILEFHADRASNHTGFQGRFKFMDKGAPATDFVLIPKPVTVRLPAQFATTGTKTPWAPCAYHFNHSDSFNAGGQFFSPSYPQSYPPSSDCLYQFEAHVGERVKIIFENVQLHNSDVSCYDSPDVIIVYDGRDASSPVIGHYCGVQNQVELVSSGRHLFVEFKSDKHDQRKGFAAKYYFITNSPHMSTPLPVNDSEGKNSGYWQPTTFRPRGGRESTEFNCNDMISSSSRKNGTISSPSYPRNYPAEIRCQYVFEGVGKERVQLRFTHMDLHYPGGDPLSPSGCSQADRVEVFIFIGGAWTELDRYCGKKLPPMLMSNNNKMKVHFVSISSNPSVTGFQASYAFVTNFGITTGIQDERGACMFSYYSAQQSEGFFSSPNYPGLYPRNTECHYLFFGKEKETVQITFPMFAVDGISPQCKESTSSDYVSFSNFAETEDRKMHRLCGVINKEELRHVESDSVFFRVIFKSNHVYDAEGFHAFYQFRAADSGLDRSKVILHSPGSSETSYTPVPTYGQASRQHTGFSPITLLICICTLTYLAPWRPLDAFP